MHVVIVGSPNVNPGYKLVAQHDLSADRRRLPARVSKCSKNLPCDIFLGAHGGYFDMLAKYDRLKNGDNNAFIDPAGYKAYIADREQAFEAELTKQIASGNPAIAYPHSGVHPGL